MINLSPFLALPSSLWPLAVSFSLLSSALTFVMFISFKLPLSALLFSSSVTVLISFMWWKDVVRESLLGFHTSKLEFSFRVGMLLFISSEVLFFFSFFWAFFDSSLSSSLEVGLVWPPIGITPISAYSVPLLNTVILLSSGVTITWSHHALVNNNYFSSFFSLLMTISLGAFFLYTQYLEYEESSFSMSDGVYGSTFFMSTGFHGVHVMVGSLMLSYTLLLLYKGVLTHSHHFTFEASAWYWHFVDVVWLFLFISVYWWGGL